VRVGHVLTHLVSISVNIVNVKVIVHIRLIRVSMHDTIMIT